jgi:polar amino acid transport system substrate-binding protein
MKRIFVFLMILIAAASLTLFLAGCGRQNRVIRIGIDPSWFPQNFQDKQFYVNGFVDELLLEISRHSDVEFQKIGANWDSLFDGLKQQRYDAVLSSLPPYLFNQAKYGFSKNFLDTGFVFVTSTVSDLNDLKNMSGRVVGVLSNNQEWFLMQQYSDVIMRSYSSVPEIFDAMIYNEVEGIVIDRLTAVGFVRGAFAGKLRINGAALTDAGLHVVTLKSDPVHAVKLFDQNIRYLIKKKKLQKLLRKWQLDV